MHTIASPHEVHPNLANNNAGLTNNSYIVISSDLNVYYLAHAPFVIQYWKNLGVGTLLLVTLTEKESPEEDLAVFKILDYSRKLGVGSIYIVFNHNFRLILNFSETKQLWPVNLLKLPEVLPPALNLHILCPRTLSLLPQISTSFPLISPITFPTGRKTKL